jgi:hypothetical protein
MFHVQESVRVQESVHDQESMTKKALHSISSIIYSLIAVGNVNTSLGSYASLTERKRA